MCGGAFFVAASDDVFGSEGGVGRADDVRPPRRRDGREDAERRVSLTSDQASEARETATRSSDESGGSVAAHVVFPPRPVGRDASRLCRHDAAAHGHGLAGERHGGVFRPKRQERLLDSRAGGHPLQQGPRWMGRQRGTADAEVQEAGRRMAGAAVVAGRAGLLQQAEQRGRASKFIRAEGPPVVRRAGARTSIADDSRCGRLLARQVRLASRSTARQEPPVWRSSTIDSARRRESRISMRTSVDSTSAAAANADRAGLADFAASSSSPDTIASRCART